MRNQPTAQEHNTAAVLRSECKMKCRRTIRGLPVVFSFALALITLSGSRTAPTRHLVAHAWEGNYLDAFNLINSLQNDGWSLVGHLSNNGGQASDGFDESTMLPSTALLPSTSFGNYTCLPWPYSDPFQLPFPVVADELMWLTGDGTIWIVADYPALQKLLGKSSYKTFEVNQTYYETDLQYNNGTLDVLLLVNQTVHYSQGTVKMLDNGPLITVDATHFPGLRAQLLVWGDVEDAVRLHRRQNVLRLAVKHDGLNVFVRGQTNATIRNPFSETGWQLVAHVSSEGGRFNLGGDLKENYEYGTFTWYPTPETPDFQRIFPVQDPYEIMFVTGDAYAWSITKYAKLREIIDSRTSDYDPNMDFLTSIDGVVLQTKGNVLSRPGVSADPWISIMGSHISAVNNGRIVWGEGDWDESRSPLYLKNNHGGINVYVREFVEPEDEESTLFPCHLLSNQFDPPVSDRTGNDNNSIIQHPLLPSGHFSGNGGDSNSNASDLAQPSVPSSDTHTRADNPTGKHSVIGIVLASISMGGVALGIFAFRSVRTNETVGKHKNEIFGSMSKDFPEGCIRLKSKSTLNMDVSDDVSSIGCPVFPMNDPLNPDATSLDKDESGVDSVATIDYDYYRSFGFAGDAASSVGATYGGRTATMAGSVVQGTLFTDDASFEDQFDMEEGKETIIDVTVPPGKLGVVIDTPNDGSPAFHDIKKDSPVAGVLQVGDILIAVDDEDCRAYTALKVSKIIARRIAYPRKLTILRREVIDS